MANGLRPEFPLEDGVREYMEKSLRPPTYLHYSLMRVISGGCLCLILALEGQMVIDIFIFFIPFLVHVALYFSCFLLLGE